MAKIIRHCPACFEKTGDTYEFDTTLPVGLTCEDCGSRLLPLDPELRSENEGWLGDRDYSEPFEDDSYQPYGEG